MSTQIHRSSPVYRGVGLLSVAEVKKNVEIEYDEGKPIRINDKFKENHLNMDVSGEDVEKIKNKVLGNSRSSVKNRKKMDKFRGKKG